MWEYMRPDELYHNQYQKGLHWKWKKKKKAIKEFINPSPKVVFEEAKVYEPGSYEDRNAKFHRIQNQKKREYKERQRQKNPIRRMFSDKSITTTHRATIKGDSTHNTAKRLISNNINNRVTMRKNVRAVGYNTVNRILNRRVRKRR